MSEIVSFRHDEFNVFKLLLAVRTENWIVVVRDCEPEPSFGAVRPPHATKSVAL